MAGGDRATRRRILDQAAALFAERGFEKVTVREICRAARANVAAVNYHFGDKRSLYVAVVKMAIEIMPEECASIRSMARCVLPVLVGPSTAVTPAPRVRDARAGCGEKLMAITRPNWCRRPPPLARLFPVSQCYAEHLAD